MNYNRAERIRQLLENQLNPDSIRVEDDSWKHAGHAGVRESGGGHFRVTIIAECFSGQSIIQRHRMVNEALRGEFGPTIHALSIEAKSPDEE